MTESFDSQSIGLRAQKKILGKMTSRKVIQSFIDDRSSRLLDNLYHLAKDYADRKRAEKVIKHMIKTVIKIGILYRNDQFNAEELEIAENFKKKFRTVAMTIVSFAQVDFSYDRTFLMGLMSDCCEMLKKLVSHHLTDKSAGRIDNVFQFFGSRDFLDAVFKPDGPHKEAMTKVVQDLSGLLDNNIL